MVKLSIDLPARHKLAAGGYQAIPSASIPIHDLRDGAGKIRVIAGEFNEIRGPARTFIPIDIWDLRLSRGADILLDMSEGNTALLVVLTGTIEVAGKQFVTEAEMALLSRQAGSVRIRAEGDAMVLGGTPNAEPIAGHGPFVMNCEAEIR
jgi:redox-sensitive bicupin YhaK (pirin superfamily)